MPWDQLAREFEDGDILYGLDQGRGDAKRAILAERRQVEKRSTILCCFVRTQRFERILIQNDITNSVFDAQKPGLRSEADIRKTREVKADPERAVEFRGFVAEHPKYGLADYQPSAVDPMTVARAAWLKTSKAGLAFQATRRPGHKIHFVLDGLDFSRVLAQTSAPAEVARTVVTSPLDITSAEVRWLFRNRSNARVADAVVFWLDGVKTEPPWQWPQAAAQFANFLYTKSQHLADEQASGDFKNVLEELRASIVLQRLWRGRKGRYYVREGDSLASIAQTHGVSVDNLMLWNNLASQAIQPGWILKLKA